MQKKGQEKEFVLHCFKYFRIWWFQAWGFAEIGCHGEGHLWIQKLDPEAGVLVSSEACSVQVLDS